MNSTKKMALMFLLLPIYTMRGMEAENDNDKEKAVDKLVEIIALWDGKESQIDRLKDMSLHWGAADSSNGPARIIVNCKKDDPQESLVTLYSRDGQHAETLEYNLFISLLNLVKADRELAKNYLLKKINEPHDSESQATELQIRLNEPKSDKSDKNKIKHKKPKQSKGCCVLD